MGPEELLEYRYRAVREVLGGSPIGEVAARYGTSRQSVHTWRKRFEEEGRAGLADRSRRPHSSPTRLPADVEARICDLRRRHPRWGARRISHELRRQQVDPVPSHATVHRVLTRNGLVRAQDQQRKRTYRRWQRAAPMQLWQMDLVGGVFLADGRECKMVTGIDDHSRFVVITKVVPVPTGRAVCEAFAEAMRRYGVPSEVLTDNGKQFTGRFVKPLPVEVMFERVCRQNGVTTRLTKPRSPTTTGKVERFHKTLRREFLDQSGPFASVEAAQAAIDEWTASYNHHRPHQAIDMATPAQRFRPNGPAAVALPAPRTAAFEPAEDTTREDEPLELVEPAPAPPQQAGAIEFEITVPPKGATTLASHGQSLWIGPAWAGRTATIWADQRTIHVTIDGRHIRTVPSRLSEDHLRQLVMRGARPAGPPPAPSALPGRGGRRVVPAGEAVEIQRNIDQNGCVNVAGRKFRVGPEHSGRRATLRLDGHLMHAISQDVLVATWPCPVPRDQLPTLKGAHTPSGPLPPRPLPAGSVRVQRRVGKSGTMMVGNQKMLVGPIHAGKIVTVIVEDTHFRVLHGEEELAVHQRKTTGPITQVKVYARHSRPKT